MRMKLLLAVDGSACSLRAVGHVVAIRQAWRMAPQVHLLNVHPPIPIARARQQVGHDNLQRYYREEGEAQLAAAEATLRDAGIDFVRHLHVGDPGEVIVQLAHELGCDWIVVGNQGRSALADAVIGSVSRRVLKLASCPVLLVK